MSLRSIRLLSLAFAAVALAFVPTAATAAVNVGDKPTINVKSVDGKPISLEALKGKMVLIDFWATWCGPCMQQAPHMVELNNKYGDKGLAIIGISLDRDTNQMVQGAKQAGFTWPQHIDAGGVLSGQFGVDGIPACYLVGPDGTVLWTGHPGGIDGPLEEAFRTHPPQMVDPKVLQQATELLTEAQEKATAGDAAAALKVMGKVPAAAQKNEEFAAKFLEVRKTLEAAAETLLEEVEPLVQKKDYPAAVRRLKDLSLALADVPVGAKAKRRLAELQAMPAVQKAVETAERNAKANDALAEAQSLRTAKRHEVAYRRFKEVAKNFAGTPAATKADAVVKTYEKDQAFIRKVNEAAAGEKARAAFSMAKTYRGAGKLEKAKAKYQTVIDEFPNTSFADTAQKAIEEMAKTGK